MKLLSLSCAPLLRPNHRVLLARLLLAAFLFSLGLLLSGCATSQTLAAQFGIAPLPTKVARKLYGTCGTCYLVRPNGTIDANPKCPYCKKIQYYNRERAAAVNKHQLPPAGVPYASHRAMLLHEHHLQQGGGYQQGYQQPLPYGQTARYAPLW